MAAREDEDQARLPQRARSLHARSGSLHFPSTTEEHRFILGLASCVGCVPPRSGLDPCNGLTCSGPSPISGDDTARAARRYALKQVPKPRPRCRLNLLSSWFLLSTSSPNVMFVRYY